MPAAIRCSSTCAIVLSAVITANCADSAPAQEINFEQIIAPLIAKRCIECHNAIDLKGGLDLASGQGLLKGGESGEVIASKSELGSSKLLKRILDGEMPPEKNGKSQVLPPDESAAFRRWVELGAPWPANRVLDRYERTTETHAGRDWWSLQPIERPAVPTDVSGGSAIDAFIRLELRKRSLQPSSPALPRILLRRLYFDMIGLPPSYEQVVAFEQDSSLEAYSRIVDRLLQSPRFGERWARYWLDVVRFAETNGYERDAVKPHAWRYRDWVINALNSDMPYSQFATHQLAGDEIADSDEQSVIATGFIRMGTWDDEPNDPLEYQYDRLEDMVHATTTAFLGLTVKCARCHDHKFDPIPQKDYYRIAAAFWAGPVAHRKREWNGGPTAEELGYDVLGWTDLAGAASELRLLKKGNVLQPGPVIDPGSLTNTVNWTKDFVTAGEKSKSSLRRMQLAQWIADGRNPLTARVAVNRIWQRLFGEGLVRSPDNFGFQGQKPSHPELLDWLARELIDGGWEQKRILKSILLSETYRQSSIHPQQKEYEQLDSSNSLLWRGNRRRLDAEAIRDSILWSCGQLDLRMGGASFYAPINAEALEGLSMKSKAYQASTVEQSSRRSVYMFAKRSLAVPLMTVFDCCDTTAPAGKREVTIVAPQALTLFNNESIHAASRAMAQRVAAFSSDPLERVDHAWRLALGRSPSVSERKLAVESLPRSGASMANAESTERGWSALCHVLINTNEFIFVD